MKYALLSLLVCVVLSAIVDGARSEDKTARPGDAQAVRVGVYDSRAVAYARFWTDAQQKNREKTIAEAKAAKQSGDTMKLDELKKTLRQGQRQIHRQVFSTAPVDDVLQEVKDRLPAIQKQAGVSELISKWDAEKLKQYPSAEKVDVTDLLVREFKPTPEHLKMIESIKKAKPVTLDQADACH